VPVARILLFWMFGTVLSTCLSRFCGNVFTLFNCFETRDWAILFSDLRKFAAAGWCGMGPFIPLYIDLAVNAIKYRHWADDQIITAIADVKDRFTTESCALSNAMDTSSVGFAVHDTMHFPSGLPIGAIYYCVCIKKIKVMHCTWHIA